LVDRVRQHWEKEATKDPPDNLENQVSLDPWVRMDKRADVDAEGPAVIRVPAVNLESQENAESLVFLVLMEVVDKSVFQVFLVNLDPRVTEVQGAALVYQVHQDDQDETAETERMVPREIQDQLADQEHLESP